jgi:hypothetical protein
VLAGVVLHVVEPAVPIDLPTGRIPIKGLCQNVDDRTIILARLNINDDYPVEGAEVVGLAPAGGVKVSLIEDDSRFPAALHPLKDGGGEIHRIGVVVIKSLSHTITFRFEMIVLSRMPDNEYHNPGFDGWNSSSAARVYLIKKGGLPCDDCFFFYWAVFY